MLSVAIAGTIGMGFMTALLLVALKALGKYRDQQKTNKKIDAAKRQERIKAVVELVAADHRQALRRAAKVQKRPDSGRQLLSKTVLENGLKH